jgi:uncharacterized Zn finger protein (UPF0148 family)
MHSVSCPTCGTRIEVDFLPVAGKVWCPTCQKVFSPRPKSEFVQEADNADRRTDLNGTDAYPKP